MANLRTINGVISYPLKSGSAPAVINGVLYNWEVAAVGGLSATPTGSLPAMAGVLTRKVNYKRTLTGAI